MDDVALLSENSTKLQDFLDCQNDSVGMFEVRFTSSKCQMLFQDWMIDRSDQLGKVDRFSYLGSCVLPGGRISDEVSPDIQNPRLALTNLKHIWYRYYVRLSVRDQVCIAGMRSVLFCRSETWPLSVEDVRRLLMLEYRCLCLIGEYGGRIL